jgi:hypothetical protein
MGVDVHAIATIGTPFLGSKWANLLVDYTPSFIKDRLSLSIKQMAVGTDFLKELKAKMDDSTIPYYYFAAEEDLLVASSSTHIEIEKENHRFTSLDRHGHLSIMTSHRLVWHIQYFLEKTCNQLLGIPMSELNEDELLNGFSLLEEKDESDLDPVSDISQVCIAIDNSINELKQRTHQKSSELKEMVLLTLKTLLLEMAEGKPSQYYPDIKTIGAFIQKYMCDKNMGQGKTPMSILAEPLNYSLLSGFFESKSASQLEIENLIGMYWDIPLPCYAEQEKDVSVANKMG